MKENNYRQDVSIDESALDVEWLKQSSLVFKYSEASAHYKKLVSQAKEQVDMVKAGLDKAIRINPKAYNLEKVTEASIAAEILMDAEYKEAMNDLIEAQYEFNMCNGAIAALQDKRSALENLVKLYGQNYFSGPKAPRDISKEWEESQVQKSNNKKIGESMQRRRFDNE